jgi:hypothetical protein
MAAPDPVTKETMKTNALKQSALSAVKNQNIKFDFNKRYYPR